MSINDLTPEQIEILNLYEAEYRRGLAAKLPRKTAWQQARAAIVAAYPIVEDWNQGAIEYRRGEHKETDREAHLFVSTVAQMASRVNRDYSGGRRSYKNGADVANAAAPVSPPASIAASVNGDGPVEVNGKGMYTRRLPGLVLYDSGKSNVGETILNAINAISPTPGTVINWGDMRLWNEVIGCSNNAIYNVLFNKGGMKVMRESGYELEQVTATTHCLSCKVVVTPRTAEQKAAATAIADLERQLAELKRKYG